MAVYLVSFTIHDATGDKKTAQVYFDPGTATLAQITSWIDSLAAVIDNVTDGVVEDINLTLKIPVPGALKDTPTGTPDIQRGALIAFDADNTSYRHSLWVPAFFDLGWTGDVVDNFNAAVQALALYLTTTVNTVRASDKYGNHLLDYIEGVKSFRK